MKCVTDKIQLKWLKLLLLSFILAVVAGLGPAASSYTEFFALSRVLSELCLYVAKGKLTPEVPCPEQLRQIARIMLLCQNFSKFCEGLCGVLCAKSSGVFILNCAVFCHMTGWFVIYISTLGTQQASIFTVCGLCVGMMMNDASRAFVKYIPYTFLEGYPGNAHVVLAWCNAGHNVSSLLSLAIIAILEQTGMGIGSMAFIQCLGGLGVLAIGTVLFQKPVDPYVAEESEENEAVDETADSLDKTFLDTCAYLRPNMCTHVFVLLVLGVGPVWGAMYSNNCAAWIALQPITRAKLHILTSSISISSFVANFFLSPAAALFLERFGLAKFLFGLAAAQFSCLHMVGVDNIYAQSYVGFNSVLVYAVEPVLLGMHLFSYVDVRIAGSAAVVWNVLYFLFYIAGMGFESNYFDDINMKNPIEQYHSAFLRVISVGSLLYFAYALMVTLFPLPDRPLLPERQQAALCKPYACVKIHEVAKVLNYTYDLAEQVVLQPAQNEQSKAEIIERARVPILREMMERMSYDSLFELFISRNLFWAAQRQTKRAKGFMMAGIALPASKLEMALRTQVNVDNFGTGNSKSMQTLMGELSSRRSSFAVDENDPSKLLRITTIVVLRISVLFEGEIYYLMEVGSKYLDGSAKELFRFPATKVEQGQTLDLVIAKMTADLGMMDEVFEVFFDNFETMMEAQESASYPGLMTRYHKKLLDVRIMPGSHDQYLANIGLTPKPVPWAKQVQRNGPDSSCKEKTKTADLYEWLLEKTIHERNQEFFIHYPQEAEIEKSVDVGLNRNALFAYRNQTTYLLSIIRKKCLPRLHELFLENPTAKSIRSLHHWLPLDQTKYYCDHVLAELKIMILQRQRRPDQEVIIESLLLDLSLHQVNAKKYLELLFAL